jgi:hypothetical protein
MSWGIAEAKRWEIRPRWLDGNACATTMLRLFLAEAYTEVDAPF